MHSIGVDLEPYSKKGLLKMHASRPTLFGLEMHLVQIHKMVSEFDPSVVIIDPISNFITGGTSGDTESMLLRLIDFLKAKQITAMFSHLTAGGKAWESTDVGVSSLIDTWLLVRDIELAGERNRGLYVLKSRGMPHSNQIREFVITPRGIDLLDVYVGPEGVLTGSMRAAQEAREKAQAIERRQEEARRQREIEGRRAALQAQIAALQAEFSGLSEESHLLATQVQAREDQLAEQRQAAARRRGGDVEPTGVRTGNEKRKGAK
jgi:circadian clock protein KaiC